MSRHYAISNFYKYISACTFYHITERIYFTNLQILYLYGIFIWFEDEIMICRYLLSVFSLATKNFVVIVVVANFLIMLIHVGSDKTIHSHWAWKLVKLEKSRSLGESCLATVPNSTQNFARKIASQSAIFLIRAKLRKVFCNENAHSRKIMILLTWLPHPLFL